MKQNDKLYKAILFILQLAKNEGFNAVPYTSLVKYLYLLDCYYAEENNGKQYTELEWRFLNFGPYDSAIEGIFTFESRDSNFSIRKTSNNDIEDNGSLFQYTGHKQDNILTDISNSIIFNLKSAIKTYCVLPVNNFLYHIYFETAPMKNATHKNKIDFSSCKKTNFLETFKPLPEKILSKEQLKNINSLLDSIELDSSEEDDSIWYDDLYYNTIKNAKPIYEFEAPFSVQLPLISGVAKI